MEAVRDGGGPYGERLVPERRCLVRKADAELEAERRVPHALPHHPVALLVAACSTIDTEPIFEYTGAVCSTQCLIGPKSSIIGCIVVKWPMISDRLPLIGIALRRHTGDDRVVTGEGLCGKRRVHERERAALMHEVPGQIGQQVPVEVEVIGAEAVQRPDQQLVSARISQDTKLQILRPESPENRKNFWGETAWAYKYLFQQTAFSCRWIVSKTTRMR